MIVSCPNCDTRFMIDRARLAGGEKKVRCGRCGHRWMVADPMASAPPPPDEDVDLFPVDEDPFPHVDEAGDPARARAGAFDDLGDLEADADDGMDDARPAASRRRILRAIAGLVVVAALLGGAGYVVMLNAPGLGGLVAALSGDAGEAGGAGLGDGEPEIDANQTRIRVTQIENPAGGVVQVFEVTGVVRNLTDAAVRVPRLKGAFQDAAGAPLTTDTGAPAEWFFEAPAQILEPGQTARFRTTVPVSAAPPNAQNIEIAFAR